MSIRRMALAAAGDREAASEGGPAIGGKRAGANRLTIFSGYGWVFGESRKSQGAEPRSRVAARKNADAADRTAIEAPLEVHLRRRVPGVLLPALAFRQQGEEGTCGLQPGRSAGAPAVGADDDLLDGVADLVAVDAAPLVRGLLGAGVATIRRAVSGDRRGLAVLARPRGSWPAVVDLAGIARRPSAGRTWRLPAHSAS